MKADLVKKLKSLKELDDAFKKYGYKSDIKVKYPQRLELLFTVELKDMKDIKDVLETLTEVRRIAGE